MQPLPLIQEILAEDPREANISQHELLYYYVNYHTMPWLSIVHALSIYTILYSRKNSQ